MVVGAVDDLSRLEEHRRIWAAKPTLQRVYSVWFDRLLAGVPRRARVLEVGAGPGFLADFARERRPDLRFISSDLIPTGWNNLAADAGRLPLLDASIDAIVGLDTLHHLPDPAGLFAEAGRVLRPGGCLVLLEPWVSLFSYPIYRWLHQEDCDSSINEWHPFERANGKAAFDGNAAIPGCLVKRTMDERWTSFALARPTVERMNAFPYLLSLGFRPSSLLPAALVGLLLGFDRATGPLSHLTAMRATLQWRRL